MSFSVSKACEVIIDLVDGDNFIAAQSNPLRIVQESELVHFWGDMHGQSEETIGNNSARQYFEFARDKAFIDATGHQGNDLQITNEFWGELDRLSAEFNVDGSFVVLPWDMNGQAIPDWVEIAMSIFLKRVVNSTFISCVLVEDQSDIDTDCNSAAELFEALTDHKEFDVVSYAHCGGRYADVKLAHDGHFEKIYGNSLSWGTFEWLVQDALEMGYRCGIVSNSDGHKGRPGASYPGASLFGAVGGLTCFLMPELSRKAMLDCIRKRHHYGTTGGHGGRMIIDVQASFDKEGTLYHDDPNLGPAEGAVTQSAIMGDIVHFPEGGAKFLADIIGAAPIERIDIFNGLDHIETIRPYRKEELGNRIRVVWEGAEYSGPIPPGDLGWLGSTVR